MSGMTLAGVADQLQILLPVVAAVHLPQDPVVAGLERQVELYWGMCWLWAITSNSSRRGVLGMGGHKPDAVIPGDRRRCRRSSSAKFTGSSRPLP